MPAALDALIAKVASHVKPRKYGQDRKGAAIAILKSKRVIRQKGKHLMGAK